MFEGYKQEEVDEDFREDWADSDIPVLLDFGAEWCMPCKMLTPIIDEIAKEYDGKIKVVKIDIDKSRNLTKDFNINAVPIILLIKDGEEVKRFVGVRSKEDIVEEIDKLIDKRIPNVEYLIHGQKHALKVNGKQSEFEHCTDIVVFGRYLALPYDHKIGPRVFKALHHDTYKHTVWTHECEDTER